MISNSISIPFQKAQSVMSVRTSKPSAVMLDLAIETA
jgi:hypothetical protein